MDNKRITKREVKWFVGGVTLATTTAIIYRRFEFGMIGLGVAKVIHDPKLLAEFQKATRHLVK